MGNAQLRRKSEGKGQQDETKDSAEGANDSRSASEVHILCRRQFLESAQCKTILTNHHSINVGFNERARHYQGGRSYCRCTKGDNVSIYYSGVIAISTNILFSIFKSDPTCVCNRLLLRAIDSSVPQISMPLRYTFLGHCGFCRTG